MAEVFDNEDSTRFFQLIHMFQRSALLHMGYLPDQEGNTHYNLAEAKEAIDLMRMLKNKTTGNLSDKESTMLNGVISEIQLQFMRAPERRRKAEDEKSQSEAIRETFANPQQGPVEDLSED